MRDIFAKDSNKRLSQFNVIDDKNKVKGVLKLENATLRNFYTFIDLHVKNNLNLIPIIAIDFSLANLTFDP